MDMFEILKDKKLETSAPLAERMKPQNLEEFVGQKQILGNDKLLRKLIKADRLGSIILYGPPGTGKTSLAKIIAKTTESEFVVLNAVMAGVKDIREVVARANDDLALYGKKTILFIDEIHRFNKSQQDALLPHVEKGLLVLIGATTENPYFEVNRALLSRSNLFKLEKLESKDIRDVLDRAIKDDRKGLGMYNVEIEENALEFLAEMADGDARRGLNTLELSVLSQDNLGGKVNVNVKTIEECIMRKSMDYDKGGDSHYDIVSAFIKSMRGSDPNAAVHYLAKMIYGGEDPKFIARRIVICAAEDVGNADPMALVVANNAAQAIDFIGMPEGRIILSQAAIYVASAPKSNAAYLAINDALADVENINTGNIPYKLKDGTSIGLEGKYNSEMEKHDSYKYPHDYDGNHVIQQYLPDAIKNKKYYKPTKNGKEDIIGKRLESLNGKG